MIKVNLVSSCRRLGVIFMLSVLAVTMGHAQTTTQGSIGGTVSDSSGAVVGNASVTIVNVGTNATIMLTTDDSGFYKAPLVEPGTYSVTVKRRISNITRPTCWCR